MKTLAQWAKLSKESQAKKTTMFFQNKIKEKKVTSTNGKLTVPFVTTAGKKTHQSNGSKSKKTLSKQ